MQMGQWQDATSQQVKLITKRLNELLATGVDLLHSELGVDLGLKPELPTWVILLAACLGLVLMVALWASACRGFFKKQPTIATTNDSSESKTPVTKPVTKTEDQKRKKKKSDKRAQANGRPVAETQEEEVIVKEETVPHQPEVKTEKASELKKNKKKSKQVSKETKAVTTAVKEPEEGTWETKVSHKEKREQRRKDKTPSDGSASPGGAHTPSVSPTEQPKAAPTAAAPSPVSAGQRKKKGDSKVKIEKVETATVGPQGVNIEPMVAEEVVVASAGWSEVASSVPPPIIGLDSWTANQSPEPSNQEVSPCSSDIDGTWTLVEKEESVGSSPDPEVSTAGFQFELIPYSVVQCTPTEKPQSVVEVPWLEQTPVDDWSGPKDNLVSSGAVEPSSDWNAPSEEWGNYVEPVEETAPPQEEQELQPEQQQQQQQQQQQPPEPAKVSDEDKVDSTADGVSKSKKKKKKKKKAEEASSREPEVEVSAQAPVKKQPAQGTAPAVQPVNAAPPPAAAQEKEERPAVKEKPSQKAPVTKVPQKTMGTEQAEPSAKQDNPPAPVQYKNPDESQVLKPAKKKKARRET